MGTTAVVESFAPAHRTAYATVYHGSCLDVMRTLPEDSVDSIVTDPPYGLTDITEAKVVKAIHEWLAGNDEFVPDGAGFMGKRWDEFVPPPRAWSEALRVLKPGGYLLCFAGSRTLDLMSIGVALGGFEVIRTMEWAYGSGMPKAMDISKAIDKRNSFVGEVIGSEQVDVGMQGGQLHTGRPKKIITRDVRALSPEAEKWRGWWTALKPAREPIIVARKPGGSEATLDLPGIIYAPKAGTDERPTYENDAGDTVAHHTVKPLALIRECIDLITPRNGVVLDPYVGSGTTCEAATQEALYSIGIELEEDHIPLIIERLAGRDLWAGGLLDA